MTIYRLIAPDWALKQDPSLKKVIEGEFTDAEIKRLNANYNIYYLPNTCSLYTGGNVSGSDIDTFSWVFVDCDLKDGLYPSKEAFISVVEAIEIPPTKVVDSGNGVHVYWKVSDLGPDTYLRLQRRLVRLLQTDDATCSIYQLLRLPGTNNIKDPAAIKACTTLAETDIVYTSEQLDQLLPAITQEDETWCKQHYDRTFNIDQGNPAISDKLPASFGKLLAQSKEAKALFAGDVEDRSKADYRLGHLMFANGFTKADALSVLVNTAKALQRAPTHRQNYAYNIVDKIWTFESAQEDTTLDLSYSVKEILAKSGDTLKGTPFRCHKRIDNTAHGFRLGQVIGLVAGSGVGKTAFALNMFSWFAQENPSYHHFFVPLEQPANEIADRWRTLCQGDTSLHEKVHVLSNYDDDGNFRHLSFDEIKDYIEKFQKVKNVKVGCVVIDHIGALKKKGKDGENQDLMDICHSMKAFAVQTNTLLVMQSQSSRQKAGIGDIELDKDAAYGTMYFEAYCDYLITLWQPLKRCHSEDSCPTVTAFKFCKIRHKKAKVDIIKEDKPYFFYFDSETEQMKDMTQDQRTSFDFFLPKATNKRKADRKTEIAAYESVPYKEGVQHAQVSRNAPITTNRPTTRH